MTGEKPVRTFSFLKQAKAKCAKLQQRTNFEFYPRAGILNCCNEAWVLKTRLLAGVLRWGDFPTVFRAVFVYLRSAPWLILEVSILGSEPVVSGSGL